jgi:hypothetical protein
MTKKLLLTLFFLSLIGFVFFGCKSGETEISKDVNVFDEADVNAVLALIKDTKTGAPLALDFSKAHHYRFWKKQLYMAGATEDTHPELFNQLEKTRLAHSQNPPKDSPLEPTAEAVSGISEITSFVGQPQNGGYSTSGLLSYPYSSLQTATLSIGLYNQSGNSIGTPGVVSGYKPNELTRLTVASQGNATGADSIYSMYAYFFVDNTGGIHHNVIRAVTANVVDSIINIAPMPCVLGTTVPSCSAQCTSNTITTVCMARTVPNCSYCYPGQAPNVMFPMQGHIVYSGNVNVDGSGKPSGGAFANVTLTKLPSGGGCPAIPLQGNFFDYATVTGNKLSWALTPANFPNTCLVHGDSVLFQMTVFVMIGTEPAVATISNAPNVDPPALRIPPIHIVAGCIAEGTLITLADGKTVPIEKVAMESKVKTPDNKELIVDYSTTGTEADPSIRIKTNNKLSLLVTSAHPVITTAGVRMAKDLHVGDTVLTQKGKSAITELLKEQYNGTVWNLAVSPPGEERYNGEATTFFANGILVGDHKMQNYARYPIWTHEDVLKNLPKNWQQDYLNSKKK